MTQNIPGIYEQWTFTEKPEPVWFPIYYGNWFKIAKFEGLAQVESGEKWRTLDAARAAADAANRNQ